MKSLLLIPALVVSWCGVARSQATGQSETRVFELTPTTPPAPAMKYQLRFDDGVDRRPGNAAILYLDSILLMGPDAAQKADRALAAFDAKDTKTFDSLADSLERPALFDELDLAARREQCDWQPPFRERGIQTLLPHLSPLVNGVAKLVKVRALRQIEQGKTDAALATLRLGYELSDKMGNEPLLISGLVSLRVSTMMNDTLAQLMNRPEAPNLYWALSESPSRLTVLRNSIDGERLTSSTFSIPNLATFKAGEELSAEQWRGALDYLVGLIAAQTEAGVPPKFDPVQDASPGLLQQARRQYAQTHQMTIEQAAKIDPAIVLGSFYSQQYQIAFDGMYKLHGLPYPVLLAKGREYTSAVAKLVNEQPANPFLRMLPTIDRAIWSFARTDRQFAALTGVEALRSYAAAHAGALPQHLQDVTETPVPENPATGKPFEYRVQGDAATLADSQAQESLTYTIRIRK